MTSEIVIAFPLLPGKRPHLGRFVDALLGERRTEYTRSQVSVVRERWYLQSTPLGDLILVYMEVPDPKLAFSSMAASQEPFDVWFREQVLEITGVDLAQTPAALPLRVFQWTRNEERE
jgi:hypothetical protein